MLHIRVLTAGAMVLMMAGTAAAQSDEASGAAPGKPVSLLQILLKPASSQPAQDDDQAAQTADTADTASEQAQPVAHRTYRRVAHRHKWTRKYAHRRAHDDDSTAAAQSPEPAQVQALAPTPAAATATQAPDTAANTPAAPDQSTISVQPTISTTVVAGPAMQAAAPDQVNMTDMTAASTQPAMQSTSQPAWQPASQPASPALPQDGSATLQQGDTAAAQPAAQDEQPAALEQNPEPTQTVAMASAAQQDHSTDRSRDRWYKNLLATLSGAFVAASVAWIMIGQAPPRRSRGVMLTYETEYMRQ